MKTFVLQDKELEYYQKYAIDKGFTHVKLEFEANFDRGDSDSEYCSYCDGDGFTLCENCEDGSIEVNTSETETDYETCEDCEGTARITCEDCDGGGYVETSGYSEDWCHDYIMDSISRSASNAMVYGRFYNDGSVDSEFTCTFKVEDIKYALEVCDAFSNLESQIGNGMDVSNAGFHMALMNSGNYPRDTSLDSAKVENYEKSMTKLIPALIFLGASRSTTRGFGYRNAKISNDKYSLINTGGSVLEFRVFDTCYDKPEQIYDNFIVMAKSLQFYSDTYIEPVFKTKGTIGLYACDTVENFYYTAKHLDILEQSLRYLRPTYKTLKQLNEERRFTRTKSKILQENRERIAQLREQYKGYREERIKERKIRQLRATFEYKADTIRGREHDMSLKEYIKAETDNVEMYCLSDYIKRQLNRENRYYNELVTLEY